jgi:hypothetical protein
MAVQDPGNDMNDPLDSHKNDPTMLEKVPPLECVYYLEQFTTAFSDIFSAVENRYLMGDIY